MPWPRSSGGGLGAFGLADLSANNPGVNGHNGNHGANGAHGQDGWSVPAAPEGG